MTGRWASLHGRYISEMARSLDLSYMVVGILALMVSDVSLLLWEQSRIRESSQRAWPLVNNCFCLFLTGETVILRTGLVKV